MNILLFGFRKGEASDIRVDNPRCLPQGITINGRVFASRTPSSEQKNPTQYWSLSDGV